MITNQEKIDEAVYALKKHRFNVVVTCRADCWCWSVDSLLMIIEQAAEQRTAAETLASIVMKYYPLQFMTGDDAANAIDLSRELAPLPVPDAPKETPLPDWAGVVDTPFTSKIIDAMQRGPSDTGTYDVTFDEKRHAHFDKKE